MNWVMAMGLFRYKPSTFQSFSIGNIKLFSLEKLSSISSLVSKHALFHKWIGSKRRSMERPKGSTAVVLYAMHFDFTFICSGGTSPQTLVKIATQNTLVF